jgi:PAS domain S-box-containing protein
MERPSQPLSANTPIFPGEGEDRFIRLMESITDGFAAFDADWRFTYLNQAAKRILGPDVPLPEELLGRILWESFPETRATLIEAELRRAVEHAQTAEFEVLYPPWNRWFSARPIEGGGLSVFFRDITTRKEAEELRSDLHRQLALAKEEAEQAAKAVAGAAERFRLFSEIVSLQVWTALSTGALDYANPHVAVQFGLDLERDIFGDAWTGLIHSDDLPRTWAALAAFAHHGRALKPSSGCG